MVIHNQNIHKPVLTRETLSLLKPKTGESYLDLTAGYGGHAEAILARTLNYEEAALIDRDETAVKFLDREFAGRPVEIIHQDFLSASRQLLKDGRSFDLILADLGVSSRHLDDPERGFSLKTDGPLDMRMDRRQVLTADTIVNSYPADELERILRDYGEEPKAARIAHDIVASRPLKSSAELAAIVSRVWKGSRTHPATRTFQALRIAVNSELEQLAGALPVWIELLRPGGRLAVISFHSLEDRIVKRALALASANKYEATLRLLTKRPITASQPELVSNPRARSAKLRAAVKIKTKERRD